HTPAPSALHSFPTRRSSDLSLIDGMGQVGMSGLYPDLTRRARVARRPFGAHAAALRCCRLRFSRHVLTNTFCFDARRRLALQPRSEEHTSELQSRFDLVCRL